MANPARIALVGGESLAGAELREVLREVLPHTRVKLVGSEEQGPAILTEEAGEAVVMTGLDGDALAQSVVILLAGSRESSRKAMEMLAETLEPGDPRPSIIDLSYAFDSAPVAAPLCSPARILPVQTIAHPASVAIALFLIKLGGAFGLSRVVAQIFEPASEQGRRGVEELQQQTTQLLTFKPVDTTVFGDQLVFNLLPGVRETETRIEQHLASLGVRPLPSIRVTRASVMHGYAMNLWVEFDNRPGSAELAAALQSDHIDFRGPDHGVPTPVASAGQDGIFVGAVEPDPNSGRAAWFWLTADNFRLRAVNAALAAKAILGE
ncbi:MAG: hypothetical protein FJW39_07720 [Acidobacteria bacterium]|nr:hypothetical protein [Acidobacteriota bacterium]